jgi:periplasmic divalent cation tolerance protein
MRWLSGGQEPEMDTDKPDPRAPDKPILIYTKFPSVEAAESTANQLVDAQLIACANILPGMVAIYRWQGVRQRDAEVVAILKTRVGLADRVMADVKAH